MNTKIVVFIFLFFAASNLSQAQGDRQKGNQSDSTSRRPAPEQIERRINEMFRTDFANLRRYRDENSGITSSNKHRVVFMGNSITELWKTVDSSFFLSNPSFVNRGIGGQTTPQMLIRFRNDVINLNPSVVVILAGTNDIAGNTGPATINDIYGNIVSMAELATVNNIKVILCSVLPAFDYPWRPGLEPAGKIVKLNTMLRDYAIDHNHVFVDYHTPMADSRNGLKGEYSEDGVHPNLNGYKVMEVLVLNAISDYQSNTK
jgi:lysophospholipase L1-like esterase